jgi:RimJ/RimL family protein N-acetyltransferase
MIDQSKMDRGEAMFIVDHNLDRCVEVWEGEKLIIYVFILSRDGVRQMHGYNLSKGKARLAIKTCMEFLAEEKGRVYSGHMEANHKVNGLLKLLGFKEIGRVKDAVIMERQESAVSV